MSSGRDKGSTVGILANSKSNKKTSHCFYLCYTFFFLPVHLFLSPSSVCDRRSGLVLPPEPQWTGRPAGAAGGGAGEAEAGVWAAEVFAGEAGGGAEEVEAAGQRSGGLHWHAAGAHHGAEAHSPTSPVQVKVTKGAKGLQFSPHPFTPTFTTAL